MPTLVRSVQAGGSTRTTTVTSSAVLGFDDFVVVNLEFLTRAFHEVVPISMMRFRVDPVNPFSFNYRINAVDGRHWIQDATYTSAISTDPILSWPNDLWRASESLLQQPLRLWIDLGMRVQLGLTLAQITYS